MNQLKPVLIEDFNEIKSPSSLQYSPDEKTLAFTLVQPDKENNKYRDVYKRQGVRCNKFGSATKSLHR